MFFKSIIEFKKEFNLDIYQWNILCLIYSFKNNKQEFYMSLATISETLGICKNTTIKSLKVLESKGLITKEVKNSGKWNIGNIYKCTDLVHEMNRVNSNLVHVMNKPSSRDEQAPSASNEHNTNNSYTNNYTVNNEELFRKFMEG